MKEPILARRLTTTWFVKRPALRLDFKGKSLHGGLIEISYISNENADEDLGARVSVKDEEPIGKKMKEVK